MLPESPVDTHEVTPKFQTFVTWGFYACIVLIGYGILNKFDHLGVEVSTIRIEMSDMNTKLVQIFERQGFNDKEISANRDRIERLEISMDQLQNRRYK